jgi:phosphoribosylglycinamide formyltransferase-1
MRPRLAVLASGGGTTTEALIRAGQSGQIKSQIGLVIVSRPEAGIFERIDSLNQEFGLSIETILINSKTHPPAAGEAVGRGRQTQAEQAAIARLINEGNFDLVASLGYMKLNGPLLIKEFGWRPEYSSVYQAMMVNTHPGLLPDTKAMYGEQIQQYILDHSLPYTGQTLHLTAENYDDGPIIAEHKVPVEPGDTSKSLFARVQAIEKQYLPGDIDDFVIARQAYINNQET